MSYWEQNFRRNLELISEDDILSPQQILVSKWLHVRCQHLLGNSNDLEAECLIQEIDYFEMD